MNLHAYSIFVYVFCVVSIEIIKIDVHQLSEKCEVYTVHNIYFEFVFRYSCFHFIFPFHRSKPVHDKKKKKDRLLSIEIEIFVGAKSHYP